jgi:hypothetical protein
MLNEVGANWSLPEPEWGAIISIRLPMETTSRMPNWEEEEEEEAILVIVGLFGRIEFYWDLDVRNEWMTFPFP